MSQIVSHVWAPFQLGFILAGAVALVALLVWLTGLVLVLRGSAPNDRPRILRAYALCRPPIVCRRRADAPLLSCRDQLPEEDPSGNTG